MDTYSSPKQIRNLSLIDRLYNLLKTEGGQRSPPTLSQEVVPTIDLHRFNSQSKIWSQTQTAAAYGFEFIVPEGKKWIVHMASIDRENAAATNLEIWDPTWSDVMVVGTSGVIDEYTWTVAMFSQVMELNEGWIVLVDATSGTSGQLDAALMYTEIDA